MTCICLIFKKKIKLKKNLKLKNYFYECIKIISLFFLELNIIYVIQSFHVIGGSYFHGRSARARHLPPTNPTGGLDVELNAAAAENSKSCRSKWRLCMESVLIRRDNL